MAIEVKHGISAAPVAAAAFGGGQGRTRAIAARGAAGAAVQADALKARAKQADLSREFSAEQGQLAFDRGTQRQQQAFDFQQQSAELAQGRRREDLEYSLTARQRSELDQLANAEAQAMASSDFSPEEKEEIRRRFAAKRLGIKPVERPRAPTPAELFEQSTYTDPKTGRVFSLDAQGQVGRSIYDPPERQPTYQDRIKAVQAATVYASGETGAVNPIMFAEAMRRMGFDQDGQSAYQGLPGGGQGPPAPEGVAPAAEAGRISTGFPELDATRRPQAGQISTGFPELDATRQPLPPPGGGGLRAQGVGEFLGAAAPPALPSQAGQVLGGLVGGSATGGAAAPAPGYAGLPGGGQGPPLPAGYAATPRPEAPVFDPGLNRLNQTGGAGAQGIIPRRRADGSVTYSLAGDGRDLSPEELAKHNVVEDPRIQAELDWDASRRLEKEIAELEVLASRQPSNFAGDSVGLSAREARSETKDQAVVSKAKKREAARKLKKLRRIQLDLNEKILSNKHLDSRRRAIEEQKALFLAGRAAMNGGRR